MIVWIRRLFKYPFWEAKDPEGIYFLHAIKYPGATKWYWASYVKGRRVAYGHDKDCERDAKWAAEDGLTDWKMTNA